MTQISNEMRKIPIRLVRIIDQIVPNISNPRISRTSPPIPDS
jgi:hypothetical protein